VFASYYLLHIYSVSVTHTKKRIQKKRALQALQALRAPRISRPPTKLAYVLKQIDAYPESNPADPTVSLDWLERNLTLRSVLPEHAQRQASREKLEMQVVERWRQTLRKIACGERRGSIEALYEVDGEGEFHLQRDPLIDGLNACGKGHDLRHLRECSVETCRRIFWAKRLTPQQLGDPAAEAGCRPKCQGLLRSRRQRSKPSTEEPQTRPSKESIISIQRAVDGWPLLHSGERFKPTDSTIQELAEQQEIAPARCIAILEHLNIIPKGTSK
jgi:hypothetical protein